METARRYGCVDALQSYHRTEALFSACFLKYGQQLGAQECSSSAASQVVARQSIAA
jgi:hypothetical protein